MILRIFNAEGQENVDNAAAPIVLKSGSDLTFPLVVPQPNFTDWLTTADVTATEPVATLDLAPGTYYVGISLQANAEYDPLLEGSGTPIVDPAQVHQLLYELRCSKKSRAADRGQPHPTSPRRP